MTQHEPKRLIEGLVCYPLFVGSFDLAKVRQASEHWINIVDRHRSADVSCTRVIVCDTHSDSVYIYSVTATIVIQVLMTERELSSSWIAVDTNCGKRQCDSSQAERLGEWPSQDYGSGSFGRASGQLNLALNELGTITDDNVKDDLFGEDGDDYLIGGNGDKLKQ